MRSVQFYSKKVENEVSYQYYLYLPKDYNSNGDKKYPLILFLHGAGERGTDINLVKGIGLARVAESRDDLPFIIVAPQCPENSFWVKEINKLNCFLDSIIEEYQVDENRIYLTGLSMGGYGTWFMGMAFPERFAAMAPVCGGGMYWNAEVLKNIPIWVFHGAKDDIVFLEDSENMVNELKKQGGNVRFTVYPEADHDSWTKTYDNPELYEWFLSHSKG